MEQNRDAPPPRRDERRTGAAGTAALRIVVLLPPAVFPPTEGDLPSASELERTRFRARIAAGPARALA